MFCAVSSDQMSGTRTHFDDIRLAQTPGTVPQGGEDCLGQSLVGRAARHTAVSTTSAVSATRGEGEVGGLQAGTSCRARTFESAGDGRGQTATPTAVSVPPRVTIDHPASVRNERHRGAASRRENQQIYFECNS